ncbi:MAG: winged helix-turn-helix transcriptional regulator [Nitrososphaerales archaeon]
MGVFELLALKGTRTILKELKSNRKTRYSNLVKIVGFSTTTSRALKAMEQLQFVTKEVLNEPYRPVVYSLTKRGEHLANLSEAIDKI